MLGVATNCGSQDSPLFANIFFLLSGFDPSTQSQLSEALLQHGGVSVDEYNGSCTHVIVPRTFLWNDPMCAAARKDGKCLCSEIWVSDCLELGVIADVNHVVYRPLRDAQGIPGTKNLVVCLTGYQGSARRNVMRMVYMMGAQFSKPLVAHRITHLICYKYEGEKFSLAKQLGLKLVNHLWLEDCLRMWALLSEEDYTKSGYEVELSEVEAKDSEDDGNLKPNLPKSEVPKGLAIPRSRDEREALKLQVEVDELNVEHSAKNQQKDDCFLSGFSSPEKRGNTRNISVTSTVAKQNVLIGNELVSEMQVEEMHALLTSPQLNSTGSVDASRSSKKHAMVVNVDDNGSLLRQGGGVRADSDFPGPIVLEGHDLGSSCKPEKLSKLAIPDMSNKVNFELAFTNPTLSKDENITKTSVPQETECLEVSCEVEKLVPGESTLNKRKSRLSGKEDVKGSGTKKQGKQSRKSDLTSKAEQKMLTAEEVVLDKEIVLDMKIASCPEVASSPKRQNIEVSTCKNDSLSRQGGEVHCEGELVCNVGFEKQISISLNKAKNVLTVRTPTKQDDKAAKSTVNKRKSRLSGKEDVKGSETKKQGKQSRKLDLTSTAEQKMLTAEEVVLDKEIVLNMRIASCSEVASSPKRQKIEVSTRKNDSLSRQGGEVHCEGELVCNVGFEKQTSNFLNKAKNVPRVRTPTKQDDKAANLELVLRSPGLKTGAAGITSTTEVIQCGMATTEGQNLPNKTVTESKGKQNQTVKAVARMTGPRKQGKQPKNLETISTMKKRNLTTEKTVPDKENVVSQAHECKSEGKLSQKAAGTRKPNEMTRPRGNMLNEAKVIRQKCFALSGRREDVKPLQALVKKLGGKLCRESHQWSHQTTHLVIAGQLRRTEKLFAAAAAGRWILREDYLRDSNEAGTCLDESKYEWHGVGMTKDGAISFEAPRKWREQRETSGCCALEGLRILLYGECIIPSLDTLRRAIRAGGADLIATCPPYSKSLASKVDFAIVNPGTPKNDQWIQEFLTNDVACVTTDFFVDFVCKPSSSLDRHILYDTHPLVQAVMERLQASNAGAKRGRLESIENVEGQGGDKDICCLACGRSDREDVMLLCGDDKGSGCGIALHIDCCKPPLVRVPADDWYCDQCNKPSSTPLRIKKKRTLKS
ncbi:hypothetical protein L7F22_062254 [Adiantum nelumboides]|nr:hypothetical protein [Adiantum nelumboides]